MGKRVYKHIEGVQVSAFFAKENGIQFRYKMEITLQDFSGNGLTVCTVMQNPSYAGEQEADKSVQFLENVVFQRKKKFPEFDTARKLIIVNQFAQI